VNAEAHLKAMDSMIHLCAAVKNVQLYSEDSPITQNSIDRAYLYLLDTLKQKSPLVFAESGKKVMLCGEALREKDQETLHVVFLMDLFVNFGLRSISFEKGLLKNELQAFIKSLARDPEHLRHLGGLAKTITDNGIIHIHADKQDVEFSLAGDQADPQPVPDPEPVPEMTNLPEINQPPVVIATDDPVSEIIAKTIESLRRLNELKNAPEPFVAEEQTNLIRKSAGHVAEWLKIESVFTPDYVKNLDSLQKLVQALIHHELLTEANSIISVLSQINTGVLEKNDDIRDISLQVLKNLASENNIHFLFKEININEKNKTTDAFKILSGFGDDFIITKLLDIVRHAKDSKERIRIIHIIQEIGQKAIPAIKENITTEAPWYFLRNMAYILGRIGDEENVQILRPLLFHKDKRVRAETLKSIGQIGGNRRGALLLSALPDADFELKLHMIEMLGKIKCTEAVDPLLDMLKGKSSMTKEQQVSFQETICAALGFIGSPEAIPILSEIAESKSFLGIGSYPAEVKYAAAGALKSIKRKQ